MTQLPEAFLRRMHRQLGDPGYADYLSAMERTRPRALRVNTLKTDVAAFLSLADAALTPDEIVPEGFFVPEDFPVGTNPLHAAGLFYMQEPSAQFPAALLCAKPHETVLDLCAAPGGKTGQLAAGMQNTGLLIANEIVPQRAGVLSGTLERLGVQNAVVTNMRPDALCPLLSGSCDAVLVDAPCSGEGMFRKEPQAVCDWSEAHVRASAERQRRILESAAVCVKPGGRLVYSTCTFSPEENEETVAWFLAAHPAFSCAAQKRFYPHTSTGEGQFAALLLRDDSPVPAAIEKTQSGGRRVPSRKGKPINPATDAALDRFFKDTMSARPGATPLFLPDGRVFLLPERVPDALSEMRVLSCGVLAGELRGERFRPAHALFLAYPGDEFLTALTLDGAALFAFLAGETVLCDPSLTGYAAVCVHGHPLGFGKCDRGTLKNHLPKGLRLR